MSDTPVTDKAPATKTPAKKRKPRGKGANVARTPLKSFSKTDREFAFRLYLRNKTLKEIATEMDCSLNTVKGWLRDNNWVIRRDEILAMVQSELDLASVEEATHLATIHRAQGALYQQLMSRANGMAGEVRKPEELKLLVGLFREILDLGQMVYGPSDNQKQAKELQKEAAARGPIDRHQSIPRPGSESLTPPVELSPAPAPASAPPLQPSQPAAESPSATSLSGGRNPQHNSPDQAQGQALSPAPVQARGQAQGQAPAPAPAPATAPAPTPQPPPSPPDPVTSPSPHVTASPPPQQHRGQPPAVPQAAPDEPVAWDEVDSDLSPEERQARLQSPVRPGPRLSREERIRRAQAAQAEADASDAQAQPPPQPQPTSQRPTIEAVSNDGWGDW